VSFDLSRIEVDPAKLRDGVWFKIWLTQAGTLDGEVCAAEAEVPRVLIVPFGAAFERTLEEERRPIIGKVRDRTVTDEELRVTMGRALARATFRGCANINVSGAALQWNEAKAIEVMTDPRWSIFHDFVHLAASQKGAAIKREEEQAKGN